MAENPRLALTRAEAAAALGMSLDSFERHVQPDLPLVRVGRKVLVRIPDLDAWLQHNAERTLPDNFNHLGRSCLCGPGQSSRPLSVMGRR